MSASIAKTKWIRDIACKKCGAFQIYRDKDEYGEMFRCLACGYVKDIEVNPKFQLHLENLNKDKTR